MESFLKVALVLIILFGTVGGLTAIYAEPVPLLKDGDVIFRTELNSQAVAVMAATDSKYTHVGVVKNTPQGLAVVDTSPEGHKATLIEKWTDKSFFNRYAVYRYRDLPEKKQVVIANNLYKHRDQAYDYFFNFNNKETYASELVYTAFKESGLDIGKVQKIRNLNLDNPFVRNLMHSRLSQDPECANKTQEECLKLVINRDIITPESLAEDLNLELIYSNYPF